VREPVLRVRPGTVLVSRTHFGPYHSEAGGEFPGEVGPIYIEGATTRDMLKIQIVKVRPNHALAASQVYSDPAYSVVAKIRKRYLGPVP
jgi:hypothetical protein